MIHRPLHLNRLHGSSIPDGPISHYRMFWYPRSLQDPDCQHSILLHREGRMANQALYSLGIVSGLTSHAYMIWPQHRPNTKRSPCGICTPYLGA